MADESIYKLNSDDIIKNINLDMNQVNNYKSYHTYIYFIYSFSFLIFILIFINMI